MYNLESKNTISDMSNISGSKFFILRNAFLLLEYFSLGHVYCDIVSDVSFLFLLIVHYICLIFVYIYVFRLIQWKELFQAEKFTLGTESYQGII